MAHIHAHDIISGEARLAGNDWTILGTSLRLYFDALDPSHSWTLHVALIDGAPQTVTAIGAGFQTSARLDLEGTTLEAPLNVLFPPDINLTGFTPGTTVALEIRPDKDLEGPDRLGLLAWTPRAEYVSATLGTAILCQFRLPNPEAVLPWATLGTMRLGRSILASDPQTHTWNAVKSPATHIELTRGVDYDGFTGKAEPGSMTVNFRNGLDPRASQLRRGITIVLIDNVTRRRLFTGVIDSTVSTPDKWGGYSLKIEAFDTLAALSAVDKYQDTRAVPEHWAPVLERLLAGWQVKITHGSAGRPAIGNLVMESTLTRYVDIIAATAGLSWWIDPDGIICISDTRPTVPRFAIHLTGTRPYGLPVLMPTAAEAQVDTNAILSTLEATNHSGEKDDSGQWQDTTETLRARNETNAASYGENVATIDTAAAYPAQLQDLINRAVHDREPNQVIRNASVPLWDSRAGLRDDDAITLVSSLDIYDAAAAAYRGSSATLNITRINHTISPLRWTTTLHLTQWR